MRNGVDAFILQRLRAKHITSSPEADRATLIRRVSLDLTGLPPTPDDVDTFVNDLQPGAYQRLVDRLLASPHYGEKGARHLYVDGGITIQRFLRAGLVDELILSRMPVLLGSGIPLFGELESDVVLEHVETRGYTSGLVQSKYRRASP